MKQIKTILLLSFIISVCSFFANAQTVTTASWKVLRYDISATVPQNERGLNVRATISAKNVGTASGTTMTLRLSPQAEVKTAKANDSETTFRTRTETLGNLQNVVVTIPSTAIDSTIYVTIEYRLNVTSNSAQATLSPLGSQFLPLLDDPKALWYPTPANPYWPRGWDTAPFRLSVTTNGEQYISSGKSTGNVFEQSLNSQPFFVTGNWDVIEGAGDAKGISAWLHKGATAEEKKQAEALIALTNSARSFYSSLLGQTPDVPIRLVAVSRGAGFNDGGTMLVNDAAFRRNKIDSATVLLIADSLPRLWIGGSAMIRGEGYGALREGLPRYLALQFFEKQFGSDIATLERQRGRLVQAGVAKTDGPAAQTTFGDKNYFAVAANKSAMVWRLVEKTLGRENFLNVLRSQLQQANNNNNGFNLASFRVALNEAGNVKNLLDQMLDQPTDLDLLVGLPVQESGVWASNLRNLGTVDVTVSVVATTQSGEKLTTQATIPARNFGKATFKSASQIVRVEVDPEKLYPQSDYSNDIAPRPKVGDNALFEIKALFNKQDYAQAETLARRAVSQNTIDDDARTLLGRILLAQNKLDEAEKEFMAVLNSPIPSALNQSWANEGIGEIKLRRNQNAEAIKFFTAAIRVDGEYGATVAARAGRIRAEAGAPPSLDEGAKSLIAQVDKIIVSSSKSELNTLIVAGEMDRFIKGILGSQPEIWQTKVLRTEMIGSTRMAVDVSLTVKTLNGAEQSGTAVYMLARVGSAWKLTAIDYFEVK
jgi:tetratricopeptide (TPR) repeat protein